MTDFENIGKTLPYNEQPDYVDALVERCSTRARQRRSFRSFRPWMYGFAAAAAAAILLTAGIVLFQNANRSPMDRFLASLSDEDAELITELSLDDIPEYYY